MLVQKDDKLDMDKFNILIQKIWNCLGDDISRKLYESRLMFTLTTDKYWKKKIVSSTREGAEWLKFLEDNADREKIIFGAGTVGQWLVRNFPEVQFDFFVDNFSEASQRNKIPILTFEQLCKFHKDAAIIIATTLYYNDILNQLLLAGFSQERIFNFGAILADMTERQYFDLEFLPHCSEEVFVDCGCYDGKTSTRFVDWCGKQSRVAHIYAFEPDARSFIRCKQYLECKNLPVSIYNYGVWNQASKLKFNSQVNGGSTITEIGENLIEGRRLDDIITEQNVTFIKMDVEGAEKTL